MLVSRKKAKIPSKPTLGFGIILLFACLVQVDCFCQEIWTSTQILQKSTIAGTALPFDANLEYLSKKAKGLPIVDRYEFRTETDEMELQRQQYQFRFKFNSRDERKAYDKILVAEEQKYQALQDKYQIERLEESYQNVLKLYFLDQEFRLLNEELDILRDKRTVLKKLMEINNEVNIDRWISNETAITDLVGDSLEVHEEWDEVRLKLFGSTTNSLTINFDDMISEFQMVEIITGLFDISQIHPQESILLAETELAQGEYFLEMAEAKRWLEFAQIQYQAEDKLTFQREISLSTSITLPSASNNRMKKNSAALELLERRDKFELENIERHQNKIILRSKLDRLMNQWEQLQILISEQRLNDTYDEYIANSEVSPLIILSLKLAILKDDRKLMKKRKEIYETYIQLVSETNAFIKEPRINYLSKVLEQY